jgi:hypothetical protein
VTAPALIVQVGIAGTDTPISTAAATWATVTDDLELGEGGSPVEIGWGRQDEITQADPNWCTLTLAASEFRKTPTGPYAVLADTGQQVIISQALRVRAQADGYSVRERFHGFVSSITPLWPDGDVDHLRIEVRAESRLAWLARTKELQDRTSAAIIGLSATSYWPMSEAIKSNDGTAKSSPPWGDFDDQPRIWVRTTDRGSAGGFAKTPNEDWGNSPDGLKVASFKPGSYGTWDDGLPISPRSAAQVQSIPHIGPTQAFSAAFIARLGRTERTDASFYKLISLRGCDAFDFHDGSAGYGDLHGEVSLSWSDDDGSPGWIFLAVQDGGVLEDRKNIGAPRLRDTEWHLLTMTSSGGATPTLSFYFDGSLQGTLDWSRGGITLRSASVGDFSYIPQDNRPVDFHHEFGRFALWRGIELDGSDVAGMYQDIVNQDGEGDTVTERIQRWARYGGIDPSFLNVSNPGNTPLLSQVPQGTALALMQDVALTDGGVLYDGRDGIVQYLGPSDRITAPVALTLDVASEEVGAGLTAPADLQALVNSITYLAADDSAKVVVTDDASIALYGYLSDEQTLVTASPTFLRARAETRLRTSAHPRSRAPALDLELAALSEIQQDAVLGLDVWSVVALAGLPGEVDGIPETFFVEGGGESWGHQTCVVTLNITDATPERSYGIYDDPARGLLDSALFG